MIEYIVNKDKRTIVAMIKFVNKEETGIFVPTFKNSQLIFDDLWMALYRIKHNEDIIWNKKYHKNFSKMSFPNYMSAKAKCSPEDEWDEEYGKRLAHDRLIEKIRNYRSNSYGIIASLAREIFLLTK